MVRRRRPVGSFAGSSRVAPAMRGRARGELSISGVVAAMCLRGFARGCVRVERWWWSGWRVVHSADIRVRRR